MHFATGAMSSLRPKLGGLLLEEYNLHKGLKKGIKDLMAELEVIEAVLVKVSDVSLDQLGPLVKIWANDVRELSYAIEDKLDTFMLSVEDIESGKPHTLLGSIKKTCKKVTNLKIRRQIASDIKDVKIQVKEVKERYDRYKGVIGDSNARIEVDPANDRTGVDPRLLAMYSKVSDLVGIDKPIKELLKFMSKSAEISDGNLKIVSIAGFGGLGKTTLAKAVYEKLNKKFDCAGFVPVGRNPDIKKVLRDILLEFDQELYNSSSAMDERQLINQLRKYLADKRYLIVIDDIWETPTWEKIKCALVHNDIGSRIITTTRIVEIAQKVGGVYNMKPLSDDNSSKLFYTRVCGVKGMTLDVPSTKVSDKFLKKCGGVPLSIITIASLLVGKRPEDWSKVYDSIGFGHEDNEVVKNTRKILSFSFYDLPSYLKTCLLQLSMFVEDILIRKHELIWIWIAEGFVHGEQGKRLFEVGESYFNQLVNRSMIQFVEDSRGPSWDGCRLHDIVLDLIRTLSSELSFVTIVDIEQEKSTCPPSRSRSIRRLAVNKRSGRENPLSMEMGHVRSFRATVCSDSRLVQLLSFNVLRVLVLDYCEFSAEGCRLDHVGKLVMLRYLGLVNTPVAELPRNIGHDLKFLQTLDVRGSGIKELPPSVCELSKLMCMRSSKGMIMTTGIGRLTSLEELELFWVEKCPNFVKELGKLTEMSVLCIHYFDDMEKSLYKDLMESLRNMHKIQILKIISHHVYARVGNWEDFVPPSNLRELVLCGIALPRLPSWINFSCVPHLSCLSIQMDVVLARDMQILGRLPLLRSLILLNRGDCMYTVCSGEFQSLIYFSAQVEIVCGGEGALPLLQKGTYCLQCYDRSVEEIEEAVVALRLVAKAHPNRPTITIARWGDESRSEDDKCETVFFGDEEENDEDECSGSEVVVLGADQESDNGGTNEISHITLAKLESFSLPSVMIARLVASRTASVHCSIC